MALTITIPGAVEATIGATAPAVLTVGVGTPGATGPAGPAGQGVPVGGTAGQFLTKIDGTNYNTDWTTVNLSAYAVKANNLSDLASASTARTNLGLGSLAVVADAPSDGSQYARKNAAWEVVTTTPDYISSVSSPLSVTTGNLTIDLSAYAPLASPALTGNPTAPTPASGDNDTSIATTAFVQSAIISGAAHAETLQATVRNNTGATLSPFTVVYINGALGNKATVAKAQADTEATSSGTFAITEASIADNADGVVIAAGVLSNVDTSAYTDGDKLYLSPSVAGGVTTIKPTAPDNLVFLGVVTRSHPTLGTVNVRIQNGFELDELHDVAAATPANNDLLAYESSSLLWKNKTFSALGLLTSADAGTTYAPIASPTFTGTVTIPAGASISGFAPLASPALTGNVTITTNSAGAALFIEQTGAGNILTLHDQATDTNFVAIDANGKINTVTADATTAGLNIPHTATVPTSPVNGDIWTTTAGVFARINAGTTQLMNLGSTQTVSGNITFSNASLTLGNSTAASTINVGTGATLTATTKAINIGTAGVAGSTTNIIVGPVLGASTTSIGGTTAASTLNLATGATLTATTKAVNIGTSGVAGATTVVTIGSTTGTSTTTLQGTTNGITAAADTNSVALATTAFVVGQASSTAPSADASAAAVGTSLKYARADHVHLNPLPTGGTTGQVLSKVDGTNYNTTWTTVSGGGSGADIQTFTTAGTATWTKPSGKTMAWIRIFGGGGGGGSGARQASGTAKTGGGGGQAGGMTELFIPVSALGATETVTVGAGGAGGVSASTDTSNGNPGAPGGESSFSNYKALMSATAGGSGGTTTSAGGGVGAVANYCFNFTVYTGTAASVSGATSTSGTGATPAVTDSRFFILPTGGGSGAGGIATPGNGGAGGTKPVSATSPGMIASVAGGSGGTTLGAIPTAGTSGVANYQGGTGGGGGAYILSVAGQAGANGGQPGGGGGGGAASYNGFASGAGGAGGAGMVIVVCY